MFTKVNELLKQYRLFSQEVTAAILMSQNNETAAVLVSHANHSVGDEIFLIQTLSFDPVNLHRRWPRE